MIAWPCLILSGLLLAFAHPFKYESYQFENSWLTFLVATLGLCLFVHFSLKDSSPRKRFLKAWAGSLIFFSVVVFWISVALHQFGDIPMAIAVLVCLLLAGYCAVFIGVWALIAGSEAVRSRPLLLKIIAWASFWTFCEACRQYLFTGFSWGELGFAFYFSPWIAKTASFWGVHGLTFMWVFLAGILVNLPEAIQGREKLKPVFISLAVFIVIGATGAWFSLRSTSREPVRLSIIQPNIPQELKWNANSSEENLKTLVEMTQQAAAESPALVIWPETSFPFLIRSNQKQFPVMTTTPLVIGAVVREGPVNRNSALLIEKDQIEAKFDKIHLVPFGEFVPLKDWIPFGKLVANAGDFLPGLKTQDLLKPTNSPLRLGPLICYEDTFSRESVRHARHGANLLINLTNDAWYGDTSANLQHAAMSQFQVYQTGLSMVRATNNGLSSFMSLEGRFDIAPFEKQIATREIMVSTSPHETIFVWTYPLMEWIWLIIFVIAILWKETIHQKLQRKKIFFRN
jgi:apolipoprotein N-acyltransferase